MIKIDDLTPPELERYERGEAVWRQHPRDPAKPYEVSGEWVQKISLGRTYEEWLEDPANKIGY
jgi:hypothetical protein